MSTLQPSGLRIPDQTVNLEPSEKQKQEQQLSQPLINANHQARRDDYFARRRHHKPRGSGPGQGLEAFREESKRYGEQRAAERAQRRDSKI